MKTRHDLFVRAHTVSAKQNKEKGKKKTKKAARKNNQPKWPQHALVFDTETRITADQSLTFGVYRLCKLVGSYYKTTQEGIFYADDLPKKDRDVIAEYLATAVSDVPSFPPEFPLYS